MRKSLFLAAFALATPAAAQDSPPQQQAENPTIVVTGKSLADTERDLRDCIARHCPPDQEAAATVAHAENQLVAGKYGDSHRTLTNGATRLRRHGKEYPVPISDLLRAHSRVAAHVGEGEVYRRAAVDVVATLRAGLGDDDFRTLVARIEFANTYVSFRKFDLADNRYKDVQRDAHRLGLKRVEAYAILRRGMLLSVRAMDDSVTFGSEARRVLGSLIDSKDPEMVPFGKAAMVVLARMQAKEGDASGVDALIASLRVRPGARPVLIHAEPIKLPQQNSRSENGGSTTQMMATNNYEDQWVDIGFWVAPDGRTTDVEVLRQGKGYDGKWARAVVTSIQSRRYTPLSLDPSDPGVFRVERYTFTSRWTTNTGSRMRQREVVPQLEMLDLSVDEPARTAAQ